MITIINYGSGNIQAIGNIYKRLNIDFTIAEDAAGLEAGTKLILPGVGAFDKTMQQLIDSGLKAKLDELVLVKKVPVLGICVGMQILAKKSEEGALPGLGWIDGVVKKIDVSKFTHKPHLPHMGWNSVKPLVEHPMLKGIDLETGFYFLHSYYFTCTHPENILCTTDYGDVLATGVYSGNIYGMQFHPEKSHSNGIQLLKNFAEL
ncbi:MAG TPA: imidazole glycerol phosphate synthase subunit HisH [Patescibacteria group bacterium]|nr:imidazole glycerol phosphate synthase subunit HisH [Patescibacteria group bacterium]